MWTRVLPILALSTLDMIQFHTWEDAWLEDPRLRPALEKLLTSGKVRALGISINRWQPANGVKAVRSGMFDAVQVIYNIFDQNPEDELFPACREKDVAVIARVPFDEGSLTGTLTLDSKWPAEDWRSTYFVAENLKSSVAHADALKPLVPTGMTMPEMALRFILNSKDVSTIIPGMRKRKHVEANLMRQRQRSAPRNVARRTPQTSLGSHPHQVEPVRKRDPCSVTCEQCVSRYCIRCRKEIAR